MTDVVTTNIGSIPLGVEGSDQYVQLFCTGAKPPSKERVHAWLMERVFKDTQQEAGGYYCHNVTIMTHPHRANEFVGIIHHRYDV